MKAPSKQTGRAAAPAAAITASDLQDIVFGQIQIGAGPAATSLGLTNLLPVDEGNLGDLPWFWLIGSQFNDATYAWLNNIFAYNSDGYVGATGPMTSAYSNVLRSIAYILDPADQAAIQNANTEVAADVNTLINDWTTTIGPIPAGVSGQLAQLTYIQQQILSWAASPPLTLSAFRGSTNPGSLLNIPVGGNQVVSDLQTYLNATSAVATIQNAVQSFTAQLTATLNNVNPAILPTSLLPGWMQGTPSGEFYPLITIAESTSNLTNALQPSPGTGTSFSVSFTAQAMANNQVQVTSASGSVGVGDLLFFLAFEEQSQSQSLFSADSSVTTCSITLSFNGVTTFTPQYAGYNVSTGIGWWNPQAIEEAVNPLPNQSGYAFTTTPDYNFLVNGNFGVLARLLISQQPTITVSYTTSNYSAFESMFQSQSSWGVSFLGIGLAGGSQSAFSASTSFNAQSNTVTLTMSPAGVTVPVSPNQGLAYVIGAEIFWPGVSTAQNQAGI